MNALKRFFKKYSQAWTLLYVFIYFPWFFYLEQKVTRFSGFINIHTVFDDMIPFCEYFIIPYLMWFGYTVFSVLYFLFKRPKKEFYRLTAIMFIGMTISLLIYTLFPNGQTMRPPIYPTKNLCSYLVMKIYQSDTSTNVFPSLHVFVSLAVNVGWWNSPVSREHFWIKPASAILSVSICLSTVFLKQHSVLDGMAALVLCILLYFVIYQLEWTKTAVSVVSKELQSFADHKRKTSHRHFG